MKWQKALRLAGMCKQASIVTIMQAIPECQWKSKQVLTTDSPMLEMGKH